MSLLTVTNISHGYGERTILKNANFRMLKGEHIGLVGANGEGKSTFIQILLGNQLPEEGKIEWAKHVRVGYLDQFTVLEKGKTIREILQTAFKSMYDMEDEISKLYEDMANMTEDEMNSALEEIGDMQSYLDNSGFYLIDSRINEVANGLGLGSIGLDTNVENLSGGQRAKVLLTKLLLENPQVLILDEPTNFLDEYQVAWLKNYLQNFENAFLLVSHDEEFMNDCVNVIYHIDNGNFTRYTGNYKQFLQAYEVKKRQLEAAYDSQQKEIAKMEDFIARNKARVATRAMANSRQKKLDKMELVEKAKDKIKPKFVFNVSRPTGKVLFRCENLVIGYDEPLSIPINLEILRGEKVAIKGVNGLGKTTFIKTILGKLNPIAGSVWRSPALDIGYFEQEVPENRKTPFNEILDTFPQLNNGEIHYFLNASGLTNENQQQMIMTLSGGEAAKVRLCKLTIEKTNVLVLDEPTNHLDVLAKDALAEAIEKYEGTVIIVTHEESFLNKIATKVVNMADYKK